MKLKKSLWKKIVEPEDKHLFGELFLILASVLITKGLDKILPEFISVLLYLCFGFLFALLGIKLLRKSEK